MYLAIPALVLPVHIHVQIGDHHCMIKCGIKIQPLFPASTDHFYFAQFFIPYVLRIGLLFVKIPTWQFLLQVLFCPFQTYCRDGYLNEQVLILFFVKLKKGLLIFPFIFCSVPCYYFIFPCSRSFKRL